MYKLAMAKLGYGLARAISLLNGKALLNALQAVKQQLEAGKISRNRLKPEQDDDFFTYTPTLTRSQPITCQPKPALLLKEDSTDAPIHLAAPNLLRDDNIAEPEILNPQYPIIRVTRL